MPQKDVTTELLRDHREVEKLFSRYAEIRQGKLDDRRRARLGKVWDAIRRELSIHAAAEEMVLYPEIRTAIPGRGGKLADEGLEEHDGVKRALADLDGSSPGEAEFDRRMSELVREVGHHVAEEEREILSELPKHLPPERLRDLGRAIVRAKSIAPTRPHPLAPNRPPGNVVAGLVVGAIDRMRDALTGGQSSASDPSPRKRAAKAGAASGTARKPARTRRKTPARKKSAVAAAKPRAKTARVPKRTRAVAKSKPRAVRSASKKRRGGR